ncbi:hypothetical protein thsps21_15970 [Pseudomonas sp. No.21]|uniref:hypothetical protein n=1 Tax=Pseudomonas TaxID=286 RepID=UPI0003FC9A8C|nr:hypothetical protein [Pseudomonas tohonis]GJN44601.1 hypothetical protein TUM20249_05870 [Pseudomonas tohonis]
MSTHRFTLVMPASADATFEAFHNHRVRLQWDTLLAVAHMEAGDSHPSIGAVSFNRGKGWKRLLAMRTRFVNYQPGKVAAAMLVEPTGLFESWAASMRHRDIEAGRSELIYSFSLTLRPRWLGVLLDPLANRLFAWEARRRFAALAVFLARK